jgi:hypothetical protein
MSKFKKKPVTIEAVQFNTVDYDDNNLIFDCFSEIPEWLSQAIENKGVLVHKWPAQSTYGLTIATLEGEMNVSDGDWIIQGIHNELYPCKPDIFEQTYEAIDE